MYLLIPVVPSLNSVTVRAKTIFVKHNKAPDLLSCVFAVNHVLTERLLSHNYSKNVSMKAVTPRTIKTTTKNAIGSHSGASTSHQGIADATVYLSPARMANKMSDQGMTAFFSIKPAFRGLDKNRQRLDKYHI